jgi:hypothetical protein
MKAGFGVAVTVRNLKFDTIYTKYISGDTKEAVDEKLKIFLNNVLMQGHRKNKFYVDTHWIVTGSKEACVMINKNSAHETWCNGFKLTKDEIKLFGFILLKLDRKFMIEPFRKATGRELSQGAINTQVQNLLRKLEVADDTKAFDLYYA